MSVDIKGLKLDWNNFEDAGKASRDFLRELVEDKETLRDMVYGVEDRPDLFGMCERHQLLDYLVIEDRLDSGWRLRINMSTEEHLDRPHDHRFSFSSYIVTGGYQHVLYEAPRPVYDSAAQDDESRRYQDRLHPDERDSVHVSELTTLLTRFEGVGSSYTLHHTAIHTTVTTIDTVSLFLRGPAEKNRSIIMDRHTGRMWWRYSQVEETAERRAQKQMSIEDYRMLRGKLERLNVI